MGYTQVALEDRILQMYPEILNKGISPRISFDEQRDTWLIKLKKDGKEITICLNKEDADACMDNTYCKSFGEEVGKAVKEFAA
ncbi:MAG: hypothetical protein AB1442_00525 [Nitrospirota bacterium]